MKQGSKSYEASAVNGDGRIVGIDIGATGVRAAVLSPGHRDTPEAVGIQALGHVGLPLGAVVNGVVTDQGAVSAAVKHLAHENGFAGRNVVLATTNQQVVVRDLEMPNLPPEQLRLALPFQAKDTVALPLDEVVLDFIPLVAPPAAASTVSGMLVAAPRQPILAAVQAVERAGLTVARVDLASFAALRFLAERGLEAEAVVDLGAHLSSIVIHHRGVPKVVRTVALGGQQLTERLADRADLKLADAEHAKCVEGISGDSEIAGILREGVRPLLAEIRSSIHFFGSVYRDTPLHRLTLTGGAAWLPGLADEMARQHGITVEVVAAEQHIATRWSTHMRQMGSGVSASAVSVGLAMGAAA